MVAKVLSSRREGVATITLNEPATLNALTQELLDQLLAALDEAFAASDVHALVVTGAGKGFCAGANLASETFGSGAAVGDFLRNTLNRVVLTIREAPKPVVVAVNGAAAGAGVGVALAGDIVLAARNARFVLSFVRVGAALDSGVSKLVQERIGTARARAWALLGQSIDARQAQDWGLIWTCVEPDELLDQAHLIASSLAAGPRIAIGLIKQAMARSGEVGLGDALELEARLQARAFETDDLKEGAAAFVAKRSPCFKGR